MHEPLVSCIVPVHNGQPYLGEALDSVLAQSYRPLEVIVVDDGSTDSTADVVASYGDRVRYHWQPNAGPPAARNLGVSLAGGDFLAFQDADDLWHAEKLTRQMERFEVRPALQLCVTHAKNFWIPELEAEAARYQNHTLSRPFVGYCLQTLLARQTALEAVGELDSSLRLGDDVDWFARARDAKMTVEVVPEVLVYRRLHHANISRQQRAGREALLEIGKAALDRRRRK